MKMRSFVCLSLICFYATTGEPQCSKFHYEEQLLEKMIRTEIKFEALQKLVEESLKQMENTNIACERKFSTATSESHVKIENLAKEFREVIADTKLVKGWL